MRRFLSACAAGLIAAACSGSVSPPAASSAPPSQTALASPSAVATTAATARPRPTLPPPPVALTPAVTVQRALPQGLLAADGSLWVSESQSGRVVRLDPSSGHVQATISGLSGGLNDPFAGAGRVWVPSGTELVAIDPKTNKVSLTVKGTFSVIGAVVDGHVWIGDGRDRLLELDAATGKTLKRLSIGAPGEQYGELCLNPVVSGAGSVWWSIEDTGAVVRIDPQTGATIARLDGLSRTYLVFSGGVAWAISNDGSLKAIDTASTTITDTYTYGSAASDACASAAAVDGSTLWFIEGAGFSRFDLTSRQVTGYYDPGQIDAQNLVVIDHDVWTNLWSSGIVERFDPPFP